MINKFGLPVKDYSRQYTNYELPKRSFFEAVKAYFNGSLGIRSKNSMGPVKIFKKGKPWF